MTWVFPTHGGGGASITTGQEIITAPLLAAVPNGAQRPFALAHGSGDALLNYTVPTAPTVINAGVYFLAAYAQPDGALTLGGYYQLDVAQPKADMEQTSPPSTAALQSPPIWAGVPGKLAAGDSIAITIDNRDGAVAQDFDLNEAVLVRYS